MKIALTITVILVVITATGIGCAAIFEFITVAAAKELLVKSLAAIALLGTSSALLALLSGSKTPKE